MRWSFMESEKVSWVLWTQSKLEPYEPSENCWSGRQFTAFSCETQEICSDGAKYSSTFQVSKPTLKVVILTNEVNECL